VEFTLLLAFMVALVALLVSVGTHLTEPFAGLDRTAEIFSQQQEDTEPSRVHSLGPIRGEVVHLAHLWFS
jgi:subfamily B ATP-binding cassette protein MsbA